MQGSVGIGFDTSCQFIKPLKNLAGTLTWGNKEDLFGMEGTIP